MAGPRNAHRQKAVDPEPDWPRAHQRRRAAIRKQQERKHLLQLMGLLKVQRAQFKIQHQHRRIRLRAHNMVRRLQRVDGRVAAHEADHRPLHRGRKSQIVHHLKVQPRRVEPGATGHHHVRNPAPLLFAQRQLVQGHACQARRIALKQLHSPRRRGKVSRHIHALRIPPRTVFGRDRMHKRIAMLDRRHPGHPPKQIPRRPLR